MSIACTSSMLSDDVRNEAKESLTYTSELFISSSLNRIPKHSTNLFFIKNLKYGSLALSTANNIPELKATTIVIYSNVSI